MKTVLKGFVYSVCLKYNLKYDHTTVSDNDEKCYFGIVSLNL